MEPLYFVMAILGCGEGDAPCRELALAQPRYVSEAQCLAATEGELLRRDDMLYPALVAQCRPAGASPQLLRGSEIALPAASGTLDGSEGVRHAAVRTSASGLDRRQPARM